MFERIKGYFRGFVVRCVEEAVQTAVKERADKAVQTVTPEWSLGSFLGGIVGVIGMQKLWQSYAKTTTTEKSPPKDKIDVEEEKKDANDIGD